MERFANGCCYSLSSDGFPYIHHKLSIILIILIFLVTVVVPDDQFFQVSISRLRKQKKPATHDQFLGNSQIYIDEFKLRKSGKKPIENVYLWTIFF